MTDSDFSHPRSRTQQEQKNGSGKIYLSFLFCSLKFYNIENYKFLEQVRKRFELIDKELQYFELKNIVTKLSERMGWFWDAIFGIFGKKHIPDPDSPHFISIFVQAHR
jgi:hypothetical protein